MAQNDLCYFVESTNKVLQHGGMIITRRHVENPFDLTDEEWLATKNLLAEAKDVLDKYNPDGYNIGWNVGEAAGQNVEHAHLHVFARFKDEPMANQGIRYALKQEDNKRPT